MPRMANTTYVSAADLFLVGGVHFSELWDHSLYRLLVPLLFLSDRDRSLDCQPEHVYRFSASIAFHPDDFGECGACSSSCPPGLARY